nr:Ldh family oxidoreductase [Hymenobacter qilianensis]
MAISQFSYGKLNTYATRQEPLPVPGGYDQDGKLTTNAADILASERALPIGFWKGSGLSLVLDVLLTALSGGRSTAAITRSGTEAGVSQCFIALHQPNMHASLIEEIISYTKSGAPSETGEQVYYPGEQSYATRQDNLKHGIPVEEDIWQQVQQM